MEPPNDSDSSNVGRANFSMHEYIDQLLDKFEQDLMQYVEEQINELLFPCPSSEETTPSQVENASVGTIQPRGIPSDGRRTLLGKMPDISSTVKVGENIDTNLKYGVLEKLIEKYGCSLLLFIQNRECPRSREVLWMLESLESSSAIHMCLEVIQVENITAEDPEFHQAFRNFTGSEPPVLFYKKRFIGGFNEVINAHRFGRIQLLFNPPSFRYYHLAILGSFPGVEYIINELEGKTKYRRIAVVEWQPAYSQRVRLLDYQEQLPRSVLWQAINETKRSRNANQITDSNISHNDIAMLWAKAVFTVKNKIQCTNVREKLRTQGIDIYHGSIQFTGLDTLHVTSCQEDTHNICNLIYEDNVELVIESDDGEEEKDGDKDRCEEEDGNGNEDEERDEEGNGVEEENEEGAIYEHDEEHPNVNEEGDNEHDEEEDDEHDEEDGEEHGEDDEVEEDDVDGDDEGDDNEGEGDRGVEEDEEEEDEEEEDLDEGIQGDITEHSGAGDFSRPPAYLTAQRRVYAGGDGPQLPYEEEDAEDGDEGEEENVVGNDVVDEDVEEEHLDGAEQDVVMDRGAGDILRPPAHLNQQRRLDAEGDGPQLPNEEEDAEDEGEVEEEDGDENEDEDRDEEDDDEHDEEDGEEHGEDDEVEEDNVDGDDEGDDNEGEGDRDVEEEEEEGDHDEEEDLDEGIQGNITEHSGAGDFSRPPAYLTAQRRVYAGGDGPQLPYEEEDAEDGDEGEEENVVGDEEDGNDEVNEDEEEDGHDEVDEVEEEDGDDEINEDEEVDRDDEVEEEEEDDDEDENEDHDEEGGEVEEQYEDGEDHKEEYAEVEEAEVDENEEDGDRDEEENGDEDEDDDGDRNGNEDEDDNEGGYKEEDQDKNEKDRDENGNEEENSARTYDQGRIVATNVLICGGSMPHEPQLPSNIPGIETCITVEEYLFESDYPKNTLIIGNTPDVFEFAYLLALCGGEVTIMTTGTKWLPGYDEESIENIIVSFNDLGVNFLTVKRILQIIKSPSGYEVLVEHENSQYLNETYAVVVSEYARLPMPSLINAERAGVELDVTSRKIIVNHNFTSSNPGVWAFGRAAQGQLESQEFEMRTAKRVINLLLNGFDSIPHTQIYPQILVGPLEYGFAGETEQSAKSGFKENMVIYKYKSRPTSSTESTESELRIKMICTDFRNERIIGIYLLGENAASQIMTLTTSLERGLTKREFFVEWANARRELELTHTIGLESMKMFYYKREANKLPLSIVFYVIPGLLSCAHSFRFSIILAMLPFILINLPYIDESSSDETGYSSYTTVSGTTSKSSLESSWEREVLPERALAEYNGNNTDSLSEDGLSTSEQFESPTSDSSSNDSSSIDSSSNDSSSTDSSSNDSSSNNSSSNHSSSNDSSSNDSSSNDSASTDSSSNDCTLKNTDGNIPQTNPCIEDPTEHNGDEADSSTEQCTNLISNDCTHKNTDSSIPRIEDPTEHNGNEADSSTEQCSTSMSNNCIIESTDSNIPEINQCMEDPTEHNGNEADSSTEQCSTSMSNNCIIESTDSNIPEINQFMEDPTEHNGNEADSSTEQCSTSMSNNCIIESTDSNIPEINQCMEDPTEHNGNEADSSTEHCITSMRNNCIIESTDSNIPEINQCMEDPTEHNGNEADSSTEHCITSMRNNCIIESTDSNIPEINQCMEDPTEHNANGADSPTEQCINIISNDCTHKNTDSSTPQTNSSIRLSTTGMKPIAKD